MVSMEISTRPKEVPEMDTSETPPPSTKEGSNDTKSSSKGIRKSSNSEGIPQPTAATTRKPASTKQLRSNKDQSSGTRRPSSKRRLGDKEKKSKPTSQRNSKTSNGTETTKATTGTTSPAKTPRTAQKDKTVAPFGSPSLTNVSVRNRISQFDKPGNSSQQSQSSHARLLSDPSKSDNDIGKNSSRANRSTLSSHSRILPERSNLDYVRDKKRILEICYGNTASANKDSPSDGSDEVEVSITSPLSTTGGTREEKKSKKKNKAKGTNTTNNKTKTSTKGGNGGQKETKTMNQSDGVKGEGTVPPGGTAKPNTAPSNTGKKKKKKIVRKKKVEVQRKDANGRVVRKRIKGKGRDRVVRAEFFRKGKDAKIGLATIDEGFYDGLEGSDSETERSYSISIHGPEDDGAWYADVQSPPTSDDSGCSTTDSDDEEENVEYEGGDVANSLTKSTTCENGGTPSANEASFTAGSASGSSSNSRSSSRRLNSNRAAAQIPTDSATARGGVSATQNQQGRESSSSSSSSESGPSVETTVCSSTTSAGNDPGEESRCLKCFRCECIETTCCQSRWSKILSAIVFVVVVAAVTVVAVYFLVFQKGFFDVFRKGSEGIDQSESAPSFAPSTAPTISARPNLRPSQPNSDTTIIPTVAPTSTFDTLTTSCYRPSDRLGTITTEAEYAPEQLGFATFSDSNAGYCGDGFVTVMMKSGSGFGFPSLKVRQSGNYRVSLRYNNPGKTKLSLGLKIDDRDEGTFDLFPTENETSWLVGGIDDVLISAGEHEIRIMVLDSVESAGPNVDWLSLNLQEEFPKFEYFSGLVAEANGVTSQTLLQTHTLEWMSNDDSIDYSKLSEEEIVERYALAQIYHSTAGDRWRNNNQWLSEFHACSWYGITCSEDMLVTDLMLDTNGLIGFLPTDLSLLTNLILISMDKNALRGTIPTQFGRLMNLSKLFLQENEFSGDLPSELGSLKELQTIDVKTNSLNGKIPEELFSMIRLEQLALGSNSLTGTLSTSVGQLKALKHLDLQISLLSGTIPSELGELTLLTSLALGYNLFSGQVPRELGLLQNLSLLDINSNRLTGILPPELSLLENTIIDTYNNPDLIV